MPDQPCTQPAPGTLVSDRTVSRRTLLSACTAAGLAHTLFPGALLALAAPAFAAQAPNPLPTDAAQQKITPAMLEAAAAIAGLTLTDEQKTTMLEGVTNQREDILEVRKLPLPNSIAPSFIFDPVPPGTTLNTTKAAAKLGPAPAINLPANASVETNTEALAYLTIRQLSELIRTKRITATTLTRMYLARLKRLDPTLHCVITLTEERALKQAATLDAETAAGKSRGPLHGIPWGAKDLLAVKGYPTTWGAAGFEDQHFDDEAEVVKRLDAAGAILIAKLALGALAQGDLWGYPAGIAGKAGARCRNPWNPKQGSSGSSAGSASATAAGCVAFALGTETLGSISSPSTRCGATGLRPSFGLVPRTGAMALSWSMDKIGPICRSVEDCAIVLGAIYGQDGHDLSIQPAAFNYDATFDWRTLRVGFIKSAFDAPTLPELKAPTAAGDAELEAFNKRVARQKAALARATYDSKFATATLDVLRSKMNVNLIPVEIPKFPFGSLVPVLEAEGAAAFDTLTRSGRDALLAGQQPFDWPNNFRVARMFSAVDYIQAMRARTLAISLMDTLFKTVDVIVAPSQGPQLTATNLTGQPAIILPNGLRGADAPPSPDLADGALQNAGGPDTPVSITFLGPLYSEAKLAAFAHAYQQATNFHTLHPQLA